MIDAKKELQYRLAVRMLEHLAEIGLLSAEELVYAKRLAGEKNGVVFCFIQKATLIFNSGTFS